MSNLKASYELILKELTKIAEDENLYFKPVVHYLNETDFNVIDIPIKDKFVQILNGR